MSVNDPNLELLHREVSMLVGMKAWEALLEDRRRSFILKFGLPIQCSDGDIEGEWELHVGYCEWRLQSADEVFLASLDLFKKSADERTQIALPLRRMENVIITAIDIQPPSLQTAITFENGIEFHLFPIHRKRFEHWWLFKPDHQIVTAGPGGEWFYDEEDLG
jgi:hypothetical protein